MKLIRTNALRGLVEAEAGSPITDRWTEISALIGSRCGSDVAQLFAEPSISRSNGASESIARWYSDADGPAVSYSALDAGARGATAAHLTSVLARLEPLLRDPQTAPLIGPMVQIPSMADVMVVGGRPVIVNWGFLPEAMVTSPVQREAHFRSTLGQFLPGVSVPAFNAGRVAPIAAIVSPAASAPIRPAVGTVPATAAVIPPVVTEVVRRDRSWIPIAIATAVALIVLLVLLIPGVLLYPDQSSASADDLEKVRQSNRTLETRIEELKRQLAEQSCTAQTPTGTGTPPATPAPPATPPSSSPPATAPPAVAPPVVTPPAVTPPPSGNAPTNGPTPSPIDQVPPPPPEPSTK